MLKNVLFNRFLFHCLHPEKALLKSFSSFNLDIQMTKFNNENQFNKSLLLFTEYQKKFDKIPSSKSITQALKACQKLGDFQRGQEIIQEYSSKLNHNDYYLLTSMIHLLSKFIELISFENLFLLF
jgi:hypothetical protein